MASKLPRYRNARVVGTLLSVVSLRSGLLVHDLDLLVDHPSGKSIDRHMQLLRVRVTSEKARAITPV